MHDDLRVFVSTVETIFIVAPRILSQFTKQGTMYAP
jgi:hypothetical protein